MRAFRHVAPKVLVALSVMLLPVGGVAAADVAMLPKVLRVDDGRIAWGANIENAPEAPAQIDHLTHVVGGKPLVIMWYQGWLDDDRAYVPFPLRDMNAVADRNMVPMLTWEPWNWRDGVAQPKMSLRSIADGDHDAFLRRWARAARRWGKPFFLRFAHEMNGNWYPWSPGVNGNSASDFVDAWRHVVDVFRRSGAQNVLWVWSPNVAYPGIATPLADVYPGDDYVDWVGLDGYNWGTSAGSQWQSLGDIFLSTYQDLVSMTDKPVMIAETASAEDGGDKAAWIRQGLERTIPKEMPRVRLVVWFDRLKEADWRIGSSTASLAAFRDAVNSSAFR